MIRIVACRTRVVLCFKRQVVKFQNYSSNKYRRRRTGADEPAPTNRRRRLARVRINTPSQRSSLANQGASRTLAHRLCSWHAATPAPGRRRRCVGTGVSTPVRRPARVLAEDTQHCWAPGRPAPGRPAPGRPAPGPPTQVPYAHAQVYHFHVKRVFFEQAPKVIGGWGR